MKKTKWFGFIAWALFALVASSVRLSASDLSFEVSTTTQRAKAYAWGSEHEFMVEHQIKNTSQVAAPVTRLWISHSWTIRAVFIEDGDRLLRATLADSEGWRLGLPVNYTLAPGETRTIRIRASIIPRVGDGLYEAWAHFSGIEARTDRDSLSFSYRNWSIPTHAIIDEDSTAPFMLNVAQRSKLEQQNTFAFVVSGDRFMRTKVLVRVAGPTLADFGVTDALRDPVLRVINSRGELVAGADDWAIDLEDRFRQVGAFPFRRGSWDSAVVADLLPGVYTIEVKAFGPQTGTYLIETYQLRETTPAATVVVPVDPRPAERG
jgi:hypothetical protein